MPLPLVFLAFLLMSFLMTWPTEHYARTVSPSTVLYGRIMVNINLVVGSPNASHVRYRFQDEAAIFAMDCSSSVGCILSKDCLSLSWRPNCSAWWRSGCRRPRHDRRGAIAQKPIPATSSAFAAYSIPMARRLFPADEAARPTRMGIRPSARTHKMG